MKHIALAVLALFACAPSAALAQRTQPPAPRKVVENQTSVGAYKWRTYQKTDFSGTDFRNLDITTDRYAFQIGGKVRDVTIENARISLRAPTTGGDLPAAIAVADSALTQNIRIQDSEFWGFKMVGWDDPNFTKYKQGDGIDCDSRATTITILRTIARDNQDGGFDTKCITTIDMSTGARNSRNFRFWGTVKGGTITSIDPRGAHVWMSQGAQGRIEHVIASGSTGKPVFYLDKTSLYSLAVGKCTFDFSVPTKVFGGAKFTLLTLHPSCQPDAKGFAVNTPKVAAFDFVLVDPLNDDDDDGKIVLGTAWAKKLGVKVKTVLLLVSEVPGGFGYRVQRQ